MSDARNNGSRPERVGSSSPMRWLRIAASALTFFSGAKATLADAQADYRAEVPASWLEFAKRLQQQFQRELAADNESTARFHDAMARLLQTSDTTAQMIVLRTWVMPDGKVGRLELEGRNGEEAVHDLYAVLKGDGVGAAPADMPQPLRMRLVLKPRPEN
jgi:hypothetical protein